MNYIAYQIRLSSYVVNFCCLHHLQYSVSGNAHSAEDMSVSPAGDCRFARGVRPNTPSLHILA